MSSQDLFRGLLFAILKDIAISLAVSIGAVAGLIMLLEHYATK